MYPNENDRKKIAILYPICSYSAKVFALAVCFIYKCVCVLCAYIKDSKNKVYASRFAFGLIL